MVKAKLLIIANGAHSSFTKDVCRHPYGAEKYYAAGIRAYYKGVKGTHQDSFIELHFLKNLLPGYLWIFPLPNGEANVGMDMLSDAVRDRKVNLKQLLTETLQQDPVFAERFRDAEMTSSLDGYGLPLGSKNAAFPATAICWWEMRRTSSIRSPASVGNAITPGLLPQKQAAALPGNG